jgi:PKD repeat protein
MTAQFSVNTNGQMATFTDTSTGGPTVWAWNFGDGTTSAIENPTQTYLTAGTYTVTLTVSNSAGTSSSTKTQSVTVSTSAPLTAFSFARAANNATVAFTDNTIGVPTSWAWDFGDGNTSTQESPAHTYSTTGQYTVTLLAGNTYGSNLVSHTIYISPLSNLLEPLVPSGSFEMGGHCCPVRSRIDSVG